MNTRDISMSDPEPKRITERKALVIGINAYTRKPLSNCRNDASAMHEALKRMGFTSTLILDCDIGKLLEGTRLFVSSVMSGDIAFFYFAGHGGARQPEPSVGHTIDAKAPAWTQPRRR